MGQNHVTATWGIDGIMDVYIADRFTMQWCLFGEALNDSTHYKKEPHAMLMSFRNNLIYNREGACNLTTGFIASNVFESKPEWSTNNYAAFQWGIRGGKYTGNVTPEKFKEPAEIVPENERPVTHSAEQAAQMILATAGASHRRDSADLRVVKGVSARLRQRIDGQEQVGSWATLESGTPDIDSDGDGMPNA